jgi:hypothetical protein
MVNYCSSQSTVKTSVPKLDFFVLNPQYFVNSNIPFKNNALNFGVGSAANIGLGRKYLSLGVSYLQRNYYAEGYTHLIKFKTIFLPWEFHFPLQKQKSNNYVTIGYCTNKLLDYKIYLKESGVWVLYQFEEGAIGQGRWITGGFESVKMLNENIQIKLKFGGMLNLESDTEYLHNITYTFDRPFMTFIQMGLILDLEK